MFVFLKLFYKSINIFEPAWISVKEFVAIVVVAVNVVLFDPLVRKKVIRAAAPQERRRRMTQPRIHLV